MRVTRLALTAVLIGVTVFYASLVVQLARSVSGGAVPGGSPVFYDFAAFRQAARFAVEGRAALAYQDSAMIAAQHAAAPAATARLPWNYPPTFQLLLMPLALVPIAVAFALWNGCLFAAYAFVTRAFWRDDRRWLVILAPGVFVNVFFGQNGLLSFCLLVGGVQLLDKRPWLAGLVLGFMAYKPQLALAVPVVLIAGEAWTALFSAVASQAIFSLLVGAVLGFDSWKRFFDKALHPQSVVNGSSSSWKAVPSLSTLAEQLGLGKAAATAIFAMGALVGAALLARGWRRTSDPIVRAGLLGAASLLCAPYLRPYDLVLLMPTVLLALTPGHASRLLSLTAALAWASPLLLMFAPAPLQYGGLISLACLLVVAARTPRAPARTHA